MSEENSLWGAPRIHGELLKLGFGVAQSTVARYMDRRSYYPRGQSWAAFVRNHAPQIAAMDLFVVPTIGFNLLDALMIVRLARRELVWVNVTAHPTAEWIARQITEDVPWNETPRYLIRDRDRIYGIVVRRRLQAMGIRDKPISAGAPWQNCFAERLIGSIRRECVDHLVVFGERHLRRILRSYALYYNEWKTSFLTEGCAGVASNLANRAIVSHALVGGLHHRYARIELSVHTGEKSRGPGSAGMPRGCSRSLALKLLMLVDGPLLQGKSRHSPTCLVDTDLRKHNLVRPFRPVLRRRICARRPALDNPIR